MPLNSRSALAAAFDLLAVAVCWVAAFALRYNFEMSMGVAATIGATVPWVVLVHALVFRQFGLYRGVWRFASLPDLRRILISVGLGAALSAALLFIVLRLGDVPRSVIILHPLLTVLLMGGARFAYRSWKDGYLLSVHDLSSRPVLVVGAGDAAASLLRAMPSRSEWRVMGLLDLGDGRVGRQIAGVPILGRAEEVAEIAARKAVGHVILAMPEANPVRRREVTERAVGAGLKVLTMPSHDDLLSGRVSVSAIREVELEDLLGRAPVQLDDAGLRDMIGGDTVMVTGAGGSIGSELCRQIARFGPRRLVMIESSEFALYRLQEELARGVVGIDLDFVVADVRDVARIERIMRTHSPRVVFHAAAYKHVPLMEGSNAPEAVRNNVIGTWTVADAARRHGVARFVLISTDKAVNPTNVMGATKRLAERVVQQLQNGGATRFITVRFGNVLGSTGSVIPKFREQIARGGPVTVTHPEIIRYFMLIPEAAQLVLQAALMGNGGEIFVLEMGEPVKIADLARDLIRLSGFSEDDIRIEYTGLRPGEKLYEELLADDETTLPTPHEKLRVALAREAHDDAWLAELRAWIEACGGAEADVKAGLKHFVPEYAPQGERVAAGA